MEEALTTLLHSADAQVGGVAGVRRVLRLLRDELELALALCGCARLADVGPHLLLLPLQRWSSGPHLSSHAEFLSDAAPASKPGELRERYGTHVLRVSRAAVA
jgi:hypothetical protein